eukprot:388884-Pleurochrysis_carterae.AAC.1
MHVEKVKAGVSWVSRLPPPDPRPGWVLRDHAFPSCVGRCKRYSGRFRHCHLICNRAPAHPSKSEIHVYRGRRRPSLRVSLMTIA